MAKYNNIITNLLYNNTIINEIGICDMISQYSMNPVKYFLSQKFNEYYITNKRVSTNKHCFTFDDMAYFFNNIAIKQGNRHTLIDFKKNNNIIELQYYNNNMKFKIKENDDLYLQPESYNTVCWPYKDPVFMINLYLNKIFRDNILLKTDILFEHCI